jgi:heptosyltransferase-3
MIKMKTLFIQLKRLGDILMVTPAIRAFKQKYPGAMLDIAVEPPGDVLLKNNPYIDNIIVFNQRSWIDLLNQYKVIKTLRAKHYDLAIDFLGNPRSAHYSFLSGAKERVGYADVQFTYAYNRLIRRGHGYSAKLKLEMLEFLDIHSTDYRLEFVLDSTAKPPAEMLNLKDKKMIAISPVSRKKDRMWPTKKFAALIDSLSSDYGYHCVVIVGPNEQIVLNEMRGLVKGPCSFLYIDNLMQLGATIKACRLFIANDNGPKHVAAAVGVPTFTIYYHTSDPVGWSDPDWTRHRYIGGKDQAEFIPITDITLKSVESGVVAMLKDLGVIGDENPSVN